MLIRCGVPYCPWHPQAVSMLSAAPLPYFKGHLILDTAQLCLALCLQPDSTKPGSTISVLSETKGPGNGEKISFLQFLWF